MYTANNNNHHHQHRHSLDGSKPKPAGLKPLLLPIAFSPQLPSTPELGPLPLLDSSHQHHPPVRRRCSPSWTRRSSFSATALTTTFSSSSSSSCSSSSSSSSASSSYLGSSTCCSRMSHHQRQVSLESSCGDSRAFSFDSDSISSTDTLSSGSCVCSSSPSSACASTPKPFRLPTRSLSASAATSSFSLPRCTERKSLLPRPPVSASTPVPSALRELSRHARSITRSSISYSKSSFLPPIRPVRADPSSSPILLSPHDDQHPIATHSSGPFHPFFPEDPASSDLPFNTLLDKLVAELVSCATELGLQDELVGILDL